MATPLLTQIADGRTDLVFPLLADGHLATSHDAGGVSLIQWCAYYGDVSAIRHLLAHGESLDSLGENYDLNGAAFHGHWRLCQFLLENGANANYALPDTRESPLHSACCAADRPAYDLVVQVLLAHNANPNVTTADGVPTGSFMRDCRTRGESPLHRAAAFSTEATIERLLNAGARLDAPDARGDSPLSWASWHLRPARILKRLCFGSFRIHPEAVQRSTSDHGRGWGSGMETNLLGKPH